MVERTSREFEIDDTLEIYGESRDIQWEEGSGPHVKRWKEARGAQGEGGCLCVVGVVSEICVNVRVRDGGERARARYT